MKVRRDIASIPKRSAAQTWKTIIELITGTGTVDKKTLEGASSVMESLIADEHPAKKPIVLKGAGNRLVIYLLYGENAMEADLEVDKLSWNPTAGDWSMTAPCDADDVTWMNNALKDRAPRIKAHDVDAAIDEEESASGEQALKVDWGALG
ncbi:hypothetical protein [Xanthobacter sp. ZOL 2024]